MTAGVISRIIAIMPALEWGWRAEFRAADIVPWISGKISGSLGCLSLSPSDMGVQGMSPRCWWMSLAVTPWVQVLWEWNRMPFNSDVKDPAAACSGELGELGCRQNSLTFTEGLLESRSEGRDGFPPPIRQCSPCRWFLWGPQHGQDGWKCTQGAAGKKDQSEFPSAAQLCTGVGCAGKSALFEALYIRYILL